MTATPTLTTAVLTTAAPTTRQQPEARDAAATPAQILARREARAAEQLTLLRDGSCVVSVTIVSPGALKDDRVARQACAAAVTAVDARLGELGLRVCRRRRVHEVTGPEYLLAVDTRDARALKATLIDIEESHPLGRLWDLDVVVGPDADGLPVVLGRAALGHAMRRCLVCPDPAAICARSAAHPPALVSAAREALVDASVGAAAVSAASRDAALAVRALVVEARLSPKPGLVDSDSPGAHDDMDLALLEASAQALGPWLRACWLAGSEQPGQVQPLVELGIAAEADLMGVTGGVNTHRGALFAMGLVMGALGADFHTHQCGVDVEECSRAARACDRVADLATPLLRQWRTQGGRSHGSDALRTLGVTGARGEAAGGFATATGVGLPALRQRRAATGDEDDALRWALVRLIAVNDDTNLVHRGGEPGLRYARDWARALVATRPTPAALTAALLDAEAPFVARRLSPGGSADLLALTWLLDRLDRPAA